MSDYDDILAIERSLRGPFVTRESVRLLNERFKNRGILDVTAGKGLIADNPTRNSVLLSRESSREICVESPPGPLKQQAPPGPLEDPETYRLVPCPGVTGDPVIVEGRLTPGSTVLYEDACYTVEGPLNCGSGIPVGSLPMVSDCDASDCVVGCPTSLEMTVSGVSATICSSSCRVGDAPFGPNDSRATALSVDGTFTLNNTFENSTHCFYVGTHPSPASTSYVIYASDDGSCTGGTTSQSPNFISYNVAIEKGAAKPIDIANVFVSTADVDTWYQGDAFDLLQTDPPKNYGDTITNPIVACLDGTTHGRAWATGGTIVVTN